MDKKINKIKKFLEKQCIKERYYSIEKIDNQYLLTLKNLDVYKMFINYYHSFDSKKNVVTHLWFWETNYKLFLHNLNIKNTYIDRDDNLVCICNV